MLDESESLTIRATVIDGQRSADDFVVIWRGLEIGWSRGNRMSQRPLAD